MFIQKDQKRLVWIFHGFLFLKNYKEEFTIVENDGTTHEFIIDEEENIQFKGMWPDCLKSVEAHLEDQLVVELEDEAGNKTKLVENQILPLTVDLKSLAKAECDVISIFSSINKYFLSLSMEDQEEIFRTLEYIIETIYGAEENKDRIIYDSINYLYEYIDYSKLQEQLMQDTYVEEVETFKYSSMNITESILSARPTEGNIGYSTESGDTVIATSKKEGLSVTKIDFDNKKEELKVTWSKGHILHPETKLKYGTEEPNNGITYITEDYIRLATMAVYLRPMAVIWCVMMECLPSNLAPVGIKVNKELEVYNATSSVNALENPASERLDVYIETMAKDIESSISNILNGLGTSDLPSWLLSFALLRRISFFEFSNVGKTKNVANANNIVSNIYNYLRNKILDATTTFGSNYRIKNMKKKGGGGGDDSNTAAFGDNYKISTEVTEGIIAMFDKVARTLPQYKNIENSINLEELYERYCINYELFLKEEIELENYILVQYVLDEIIPARIVNSMGLGLYPDMLEQDRSKHKQDITDPDLSIAAPGKELVIMFTATQYILELWGFNELAALVFAKSVEMTRSYDNVKTKLDSELKEQLCKISPAITVKKEEPESIKFIEDYSVSLGSKIWLVYSLSNKPLNMKKVSEGHLIQKEIRNDLARLLIKLDEIVDLNDI